MRYRAGIFVAEEADQHLHTRLGTLILFVDIQPLLATLLSLLLREV